MAKQTEKIKLSFKKDLKNNILIYNEGFISNGDWVLNVDYVEIDDALIQDCINNKHYFQYSPVDKKFYFENVTKLKNLIPTNLCEYDCLTDTGMLHDANNMTSRMFYNKNKKYFSYMQNNYFKMIDKTLILNDFRQLSKTGAITVFTSNYTLIALIMPTIPHSFIDSELYCYDRDAVKELSNNELLREYQIN